MAAKEPSAKQFLIGILTGLLLAWLSAQFLPHIPALQQASAQLADPGAQRNLLHQQLVRLNEKMDELIRLLNSGQIKVKCLPVDDKTAGVLPNESSDSKQPE